MNIDAHPLIRQSYEVSLAIEKCGASPELTAAVEKSSALTSALDAYFAALKIEIPEPTGFMFFDDGGDDLAQRHRDVVQGIRWARLNAKIVPRHAPVPDVVTVPKEEWNLLNAFFADWGSTGTRSLHQWNESLKGTAKILRALRATPPGNEGAG